MKIALCMITKGDDELTSLKRAVASVADQVEDVYITTNAKKYSKTKKWCEKMGYNHSHLPWNDNFAEQRNFNFSQVSEDTDYIIWMDSDDVIINPHIIRDIAEISKRNGYDTVFFTYFYGCEFDGEPSPETFVKEELVQSRERLIRPGAIVWKKRIHETPVPIDDANFRYSRVQYSDEYPIVWLHLGADRDLSADMLQARMKRNQRLLELELDDERKEGKPDPRTLLYLMKVYAEYDDEENLKECINMGEEYISMSGWDEERAVCYMLMAKCYGKMNDHRKARDLLHEAEKEYPHSPLIYLHLARVYFNLKNYNAMEHYMKIGMSMEMTETSSAMSNVLEAKMLSAELMLQHYYFAQRNIRKALEAAKLLNEVNPTDINAQNVKMLEDQVALDVASEGAHKLMRYAKDIQREWLIPPIYEAMPEEMQKLPFANRYYNRYKKPRTWGEKEICYYANFGGEHFEKWDGNSMKKGIGGSETAVIRLSEEWTKLGYKVTVYGDPPKECEIKGVRYVPWYKFNHKDRFNIFIQWRGGAIVDKICAKKVYIDLHDVFVEDMYVKKQDNYDKLMVKSKFHREHAPNVLDEKVEVISNGIATS